MTPNPSLASCQKNTMLYIDIMQVKSAIFHFLAGAAAGAAAVFGFFFFDNNKDTAGITIKQLSGEKINHESFDFSGEYISFHTIAEGQGEAATQIPKSLVPEAYNWMHRVHTVSVSVGFNLQDSGLYYGAIYSRRFGRFSAGVGADFAPDGLLGVRALVGWCW